MLYCLVCSSMCCTVCIIPPWILCISPFYCLFPILSVIYTTIFGTTGELQALCCMNYL